MKFLVKILIFVSFLIILVECFSDVIVNNSKLNLTVYNELMRKTNSSLNSIRNIFKNNSSSVKTKKNLLANHNLYQNIRPKPISVSKDYLITKYNVIQGSVVTPSSVIEINDGAHKSDYNQNNINYLGSEMTQADLLNFLNISNPPTTSTDSVLYEQSIEVPQISAYEITNSPNHHPSNAVSPHIIYTPHQYYGFLNYPPPIDDQFMTTQKPQFNQIKPTTISPIFTTTRTTNQHFNGDAELPYQHHHKPTTSTPVFIFTYPKNHKKTMKKRQQKKRQKPELMGSSMVAAVQDTLENVYNFFEDMFTDTVQYTTHEELEESHKPNSKKKNRKKMPKETTKPFVYATHFPISYASSVEYDSSGTSDSSSSSLQETDTYSNSDSSSSEEYRQRTFKTSPPTKPSITLKKTKTTKPSSNQFLKKFKPTPNPNNNLKKLNTKRITVRSLNTQTNKQFTTPVSVRRKTTRKPSMGTSKGLVTHVHVTNEFVESTTAINPELSKTKVKKVYDSNESSSDYYDDYFDFDEFDGDDDDDNDDEAGISPLATSKQKIKKKQNKNTNRKTKGNGENYYEYDSMFAIPPISNMLPSFSIFNNDETSGEVQGRSTTPNNVYSGSKFPYTSANKYQHENNKNSNPLIWYSPMFEYGADETTTTVAADLLPSVTTESSYWLQSWFGSSNEITTENPTTTTESSNNGKWWFPWLADDEDEEDSDKTTTTTTSTQATTITAKSTTNRPLFVIPNPMPNAGSFITFLTEKINPKPTKAAPLENPNKKMHYHKYQLWRLLPQSTADVATLEEYRMSFDDSTEVQWWKGPALRSTTEILVSPNMTDLVKEFLDDEYIKFEIIMRDVQPAILYENPKMSNHEKMQIEIQQGHPLTWHRYHSYDDIVKFLEYLHRRHPDNVELIHMGQSYEGRPLIIVKVHFDEMILENSKKSSKTKKKFLKEKFKKIKKKAVFIECGAHGREWMSPAVGTWILNNLVKLIVQNNTNGETIRSVDWYILPIMNPDGYQFSFEFDRFWRKTRSNHKTNSFNLMATALNWMKSDQHMQKTCYGVDPSRNWNVDWGTKGASQSKCNEFYMGPEADSEPEIKALSKFLMDYRKKIKLFLSLHSYGQLISFPTMSNSTYSVNEIHDVLDMVLIAIESLRNSDSGTRYKVDTTNDMMSTRSGTSESFAMHEAGIKYSYIMELRDTGHHGLLLPASYIESSAKTAFGMIKAMVDYL